MNKPFLGPFQHGRRWGGVRRRTSPHQAVHSVWQILRFASHSRQRVVVAKGFMRLTNQYQDYLASPNVAALIYLAYVLSCLKIGKTGRQAMFVLSSRPDPLFLRSRVIPPSNRRRSGAVMPFRACYPLLVLGCIPATFEAASSSSILR